MREIFFGQLDTSGLEDAPFTALLAGTTSGPNYLMKRTNSMHYVCAYIQSGQGTLVYEGKTYNLSQGDAFMLYSHSDHTYYSDDNDPLHFLWFNCLGNLIPLLFRIYGLDQHIIFRQYNDPTLFKEFHDICREHTDSRQVHDLCAVQFHRIVVSFSNHLRSMEQSDSLPQQIKRYLDEHLNQPLSLKKLAEQMGYSSAHIGNCFKQCYGQTPYQYVLNEKLIAAEKLLSQTDMKVWQVANLLGFSDEFHFSNAFYKRLGYRPKTIRQRQVKNEGATPTEEP